MEIAGSTIMITGGARIGRGVASWLARAGAANFWLSYYRSETVMQSAADELRSLGAQAEICQMNATDEADVTRAVETALTRFGRIDVLLNLASIYQARPIEAIKLSEWRLDYDANATSTFLAMTAVAPQMRRQGAGRIINFVDWTAASGRVGYHQYATYYAAKRAVLGLTEAFALEYAPEILINAIAPGPILPPPDLSPALVDEVAQQTPLKRWGGSDAIAEAVALFIRSDFITGECLRVDGGRHLL